MRDYQPGHWLALRPSITAKLHRVSHAVLHGDYRVMYYTVCYDTCARKHMVLHARGEKRVTQHPVLVRT